MRLPLMPLNAVLFPGMPMPLAVFEERYRHMVCDCLETGDPFGVVLIRRGPEVGGVAEPHEVGTTAKVITVSGWGEGMQAVVVGRERFRVDDLVVDGDILRARVTILAPTPSAGRVSSELCGELTRMLAGHIHTILELLGVPGEEPTIPDEPERLSFMIAAHLTTSLQQRQQLLELESVAERLIRERDMLRLEAEQYRVLLASFERARQIQAEGGHEPGLFSPN